MSGNGAARKSARRRSVALVEYGERQSSRAEGKTPHSGGHHVLWIGLALAGVVLFALVRSPTI